MCADWLLTKPRLLVIGACYGTEDAKEGSFALPRVKDDRAEEMKRRVDRIRGDQQASRRPVHKQATDTANSLCDVRVPKPSLLLLSPSFSSSSEAGPPAVFQDLVHLNIRLLLSFLARISCFPRLLDGHQDGYASKDPWRRQLGIDQGSIHCARGARLGSRSHLRMAFSDGGHNATCGTRGASPDSRGSDV